MLPWKWLNIEGFKSHAVPAYLEGVLLDDLRARARGDDPLTPPPEVVSEQTTSVAIDNPGMVALDRPWMSMRVDGLTLDIPCEDLGVFYERLKKAPERVWKEGTSMFVGASYYKLHGWNRCIVLTPDIRMELLTTMKEKLAEAEDEADRFWSGRKTPGEVLAEANARPFDIEEIN